MSKPLQFYYFGAMKSTAITPEKYIEALGPERKNHVAKLRESIIRHIPNGFKETMSYGMIGYVVPHDIYPKGYHCDPTLPLPFINLASQKNFVALYHMGLYADPELMSWFTQEFPKHYKLKPDIGKSCIRFKKPELIPHEFVAELVSKMSVEDWIAIYERNFKLR